MTNEQIKKIFLENGFKEKQQPDGSFDLNPYVYDAARALMISCLRSKQAVSANYSASLETGAKLRTCIFTIQGTKLAPD